MFAPRCSTPSISTPASVSNSVSASTLSGRLTNSRSQLTENFIVEKRQRAALGPTGHLPFHLSCEWPQKPQIVLREKPDAGDAKQDHGEPVHPEAESV